MEHGALRMQLEKKAQIPSRREEMELNQRASQLSIVRLWGGASLFITFVNLHFMLCFVKKLAEL
jgi:hypothetical protein